MLHAYADRYFGGNPDGWSELLHSMGDFETINVVTCRTLLDKLSPGARNSWRLQQVVERLNLAEAHQAVRAETNWTPKRLAAAGEFLAAKERLYRNVWRLGLQRHSFRFESNMPDWYDGYISLKGGKKVTSITDVIDEA